MLVAYSPSSMARVWCASATLVRQLAVVQLGLDLERDQLVGERPGPRLEVEVRRSDRPYIGRRSDRRGELID